MMLSNFKNSFPKKKANKQRLVHLNNAGLAMTSKPAAECIHYWTKRFHEEGMHCNDDYKNAIETARQQLADFAGADKDEIAFFQSAAGAISQVAFGMNLKEGDEVLTWDQEYGSNLYPWKEACFRSGAKLKILKSESDFSTPLEKIFSNVTDKTKVIAISWVQFQTGSLTDLKALADFAKSKGIWTMVDVIQGFGLLDFHFHQLGIDFACGGSHKWLLTPVGAGFLIIKKDKISQLKPLMIGAATYGTCDDPLDLNCQIKADATKFEPGSKQILEITALGASTKWIQETGIQLIREEAFRIGRKLKSGIQEKGYTINGGKNSSEVFVNFSSPKKSTQEIARIFQEKRISFALRGPGLRLSTYAYNTEEDVQDVLALL